VLTMMKTGPPLKEDGNRWFYTLPELVNPANQNITEEVQLDSVTSKFIQWDGGMRSFSVNDQATAGTSKIEIRLSYEDGKIIKYVLKVEIVEWFKGMTLDDKKEECFKVRTDPLIKQFKEIKFHIDVKC